MTTNNHTQEEPIKTTATRMFKGIQYRRLSQTEYYNTEEEANKKVRDIEMNGIKGRKYQAISKKHTKTLYKGDTTVIITQYFIYIKYMKR